MKIDLHTHSKYSSDGLTSPEKMVKTAKRLGIGFAILDHNTTAAWPELKKWSRQENVPVIFGEEIKTISNGRKTGEIAGLFLQEEIKPGEYLEVIDAIKDQGGVVMVPHPFDVLRQNFKFLDQEKKKIDVVEVLNARCYRAKYNDQALAYAQNFKLNQCAGSDGHTPREIGRCYTESQGEGLEEFRKALLKNQVTIHGRMSSRLVHLWTPIARLNPRSLYRASKKVLKTQF
jgi:predicted metal-dependent phosphoesterase TrpH